MALTVFKYPNSPLYALKSSAYSPALYAAAKATPGLTWNPDSRVWEGYRDAAAQAIDLLNAKGVRVDGAVDHIDSKAPCRFQPSYEGMLPHQCSGIDFLVTHADEGALLADDMGCMKTAVALRAARAFKQPALVVCPAFITGIWGDDDFSEVKKWWKDAWPPRVLEGLSAGPWYVVRAEQHRELPAIERLWYWRGPDNFDPKVLTGQWVTKDADATLFWKRAHAEEFIEHKWSKEERARINVECRAAPMAPKALTVCNYSILHAWAPHLAGVVKTLIADEAHAISNAKSGRSQALAQIAAGCTQRIALTGTPLTNSPRDLWNLVDTISPGRFGKFVSYGIRYAAGRQEEVPQRGSKLPKAVWRFDGASNLEELHKRLQFFMLRRTKSEVALQLPPRTMQTFLVDVKRVNIAPPKSILGDKRVSEKALRRALDLAADGKLPHVVELVKSHVASCNRVVVFCWRRTVCEALASAFGVDATFIHGGVTQRERQKRINGVDWRVLCANIDVTAGGISLTQASVGVYAELTWEPHEILQTMARLHRPGQTEPTHFIFPLARGSVDELIARTLIQKLDVYEKAIGTIDEKLGESLASTREKTNAAQLKSLYERLKRQQEKDDE